MKKILFNLALFASLVFIVCSSMACTKKTVLNPGVYSGSALGNSGYITVEVIIGENKKIAHVNVLEYADNPALSMTVFDTLCPRFVRENSAEVDTVAGATATSKGLIAAVKDALEKAVR